MPFYTMLLFHQRIPTDLNNMTSVYVSFYNVISVTVFVISDMFYINYTLIHWTQ